MLKSPEIIKKYFEYFPQDKKNLLLLDKQRREKNNIFTRKNFTGHIVANSLIINKDKVLTVFHNFLKMYLQPGGHVEQGDQSVLQTALRETREETGINDCWLFDWHKKTQIPIFIESHLIPENPKKKEKQHYHHDFMYVFKTKTKDINLQAEEVSDFSWADIETVLNNDPDSFLSKSLKRMIKLGIIE
ncbi:MAG TPA: NUDIX domain-containing protein [Patescibacteria group bacterium]|nr:NUDIX domain-containing protein [Patescibacteria group bacterium]